jgi:tetratricopeptide (TPR) repeat protein/DNA-binding CsgD family transcriptional regulator
MSTDEHILQLRERVERAEGAEQKIAALNELSFTILLTDPFEACRTALAMLRLARTLSRPSLTVHAWMRLSDYYSYVSKHGSALRCLNKAASLLRGHPDDAPLLASLYRRIGAVHHERRENLEAMKALDEALVWSHKADGPDGVKGETAATLGYMGEIYRELGDYRRALDIFSRTLSIFEARGNLRAMGKTLFHIGCIHTALDDPDSALNVFERGLLLSQQGGNRFAEATIFNHIGMLFNGRGEYDRALASHHRALEINRELGNVAGEAETFNCIADLHFRRGELPESLQTRRNALALYGSVGNEAGRTVTLRGICETLLERGEIDVAFPLLHEALETAERIGSRPEEGDIHHLLSRAYELSGEAACALRHYKLYTQLRDEVADQETRRAVAATQVRGELERSELERRLLAMKVEQLEQETALKSTQLTSMALHLAQNGELLSRIKEHVVDVAHQEAPAESALATDVLQQIEQVIDRERGWETFERQFQQVHSDFLYRLSERFPLLSPTELKVCMLLRVNLSSKEIADILCISARTVDTHRTRIRKKIGLPIQANLSSYLSSLS